MIVLHLLYASAQFGMVLWAMHLYHHSRNIYLILLLVMLVGLIYDNLIVAIGRLIGEGNLLKSLNMLRFLAHKASIPLMVLLTAKLAQEADLAWADSLFVRSGVWAITLGLILIGIFTNVLGFKLESVTFAGTLRYREAQGNSLLIPAIVTTIWIAVVGTSIWCKISSPWMVIGALSMLIGGAVPTQTVGLAISSGAEVILSLSLLVTEYQLQKA